MLTDQILHQLARIFAASLREPDKKQLRFNDIVRVAKDFYNDPAEGVWELVRACDKADAALYDKTQMWRSLDENYRWMTC